jgi:GTP cyclohydrolase I
MQMAADPVDRDRTAAAVRELIVALGEDPSREGLVEIPTRVASMYAEILTGNFKAPASQLQVSAPLHEQLR